MDGFGDEGGEILVAGFGDDEDVFEADVDAVFRDREGGLDGEDVARLEELLRGLHVVHFHADGVTEAAADIVAIRLDEALGGLLVFVLGERVRRHDGIHLFHGILHDGACGYVGSDGRHQGLVELHVDAV